MEKGQVKPHGGVAKSARDPLKHNESDVLMKEIVHGIWVTAGYSSECLVPTAPV